MAEWSYSAIDYIQTPGGNIQCNGSATDSLWLDPTRCDGLGMSDIRAEIDERGQDHGWLFAHDFLLGGQRITLWGLAHILSASTDPGYVTARDTFLTDVRTKLKTILTGTSGLVHFTGGQTITGLRCQAMGAPQSVSGMGPSVKSVLIMLVSQTSA